MKYMAAGVPIVASDLPSLREILVHEENALLVPPGDAEALPAAVMSLHNDPALGQRLAGKAAQQVRNYTWVKRAERILAAISSAS